MATYYYPYPPETANRSANWIQYDGRDLVMYFTPRDDPNPVFDRFVGYLDVDWAAIAAAAYVAPSGNVAPVQTTTVEYVAPAPVPTLTPAPAPAPAPTPTVDPVTGITTQQIEVREGNDLVIYYPNGSADRYTNYFAPSAGTVSATPQSISEIPPNTNPGGFVKPVSADVRVGNDRLVTFNDGTQKILTNYFLPYLVNLEAEANGAYIFGTGTNDPEYLKKYGLFPAKKFLVRDQQDGTDRLAIYSDGSSKRAAGWFSDPANASYLPAAQNDLADPLYFGPDTPQSNYTPPADLYFVPPVFIGANPEYTTPAAPVAGIAPSAVTMPTNISSSGTGQTSGGTGSIIGSAPGTTAPAPAIVSTLAPASPVTTEPQATGSLFLLAGVVALAYLAT